MFEIKNMYQEEYSNNKIKKVAYPRDRTLEQILYQKWCPNCRRRGYWRALSDDEVRWGG